MDAKRRRTFRRGWTAVAVAGMVGLLGVGGCILAPVAISPDQLRQRWAVVLDAGGQPRALLVCGLEHLVSAFRGDPQRAAASCWGTLYVYDPIAQRLRPTELPPDVVPLEAAWASDGTALLVSAFSPDTGESSLFWVDVQDAGAVRGEPHEILRVRVDPQMREAIFGIRAPSVSPDGRFVAYRLASANGGAHSALHAHSLKAILSRDSPLEVVATLDERELLKGSRQVVLDYGWLPLTISQEPSLLVWEADVPLVPLEEASSSDLLEQLERHKPRLRLVRWACSEQQPGGCKPQEILWEIEGSAIVTLLATTGFLHLFPPGTFLDVAPDGPRVAVATLLQRGAIDIEDPERGSSQSVGVTYELELSPSASPEGPWTTRVVRRYLNALFPRYAPSGGRLALIQEAQLVFQPQVQGLCLPETPYEGSSAVCLQRGEFLGIYERGQADAVRVWRLPPDWGFGQLFWASEQEVGLVLLLNGSLGFRLRLFDVETGRVQDLTDKLKRQAESSARVLRVPEDYSTLQAAVQAARPFDTIELAAGRYGSITLTKSVTLRARSGADVYLRRVAVAGALSPIKVRLEGLRAERVSAEGPFKLQLVRVTVQGSPTHGIEVNGPGRLALVGSRVLDNRGCGLLVKTPDVVVEGESNEFRDNDVDLCGYAPARVRKPLVPPTERPLVRVPDDYPTLQEAIDAVAPGGTVEITQGAYTLDRGVTLWKPVTLRGLGPERTHLIFQGTLRVDEVVFSVPFEAAGVVLQGLSLELTGFQGLWIHGEITLREVTLRLKRAVIGIQGSGRAKITLQDANLKFEDEATGLLLEDTSEARLSRVVLDTREGLGAGLDPRGIDVRGRRIRVAGEDVTFRRLRVGISCHGGNCLELRLELSDCLFEASTIPLDLWIYEPEENDVQVRLSRCRILGARPGVLKGAVTVVGQVTLEDVVVADAEGDEGAGIKLVNPHPSRETVLRRVRVEGHEVGLSLDGTGTFVLDGVQALRNRTIGLRVRGDGSRVILRSSEIVGNGLDEVCNDVRWLCPGVELRGRVDVSIAGSRIEGNADWGVAAALIKCGYEEDDFQGTVRFGEGNVIQGNNTTGNQEGEVCLP